MTRIEMRDQIVGSQLDRGAALHAPPGGVDPIQNVFASRITVEQLKRLRAGRAIAERAEVAKPLCFVHRSTASRELAERFTGGGVDSADIQLQPAGLSPAVLQNALGLPRLQL